MAREVLTLVIAALSLPLSAIAAYWWRHAGRIAQDRAKAFAENGAWAGWVFPWQRTTWCVRFQATGCAAAATILLVSSALRFLGIGLNFP